MFPGAMATAATGIPDYARQAGRITAQELRAMGVNLNLAPVLDVNSNARNPVIGVRSFGDDPTRVADFAREAVLGYQNENVCCCGKHFPGHGDTAVDSHIGLPCVDKDLPALEACTASFTGRIFSPQRNPQGISVSRFMRNPSRGRFYLENADAPGGAASCCRF